MAERVGKRTSMSDIARHLRPFASRKFRRSSHQAPSLPTCMPGYAHASATDCHIIGFGVNTPADASEATTTATAARSSPSPADIYIKSTGRASRKPKPGKRSKQAGGAYSLASHSSPAEPRPHHCSQWIADVACYRQWIAGQESGLAELESASAKAAAGRATDAELRAVVERCMVGYQSYVAARRAVLSRDDDGTAFIAPPWCTAFERSVLWLGGCRPTLTIRLLYNLSGEGLEAQVEDLIVNGRRAGDDVIIPRGRMGITHRQLALLSDLHCRTLLRENALSDRLATLHEDIADRPLFPIVRQRATATAQLSAAAAGHGGFVDGVVTGPARVGGGVDAEVEAALRRYKAGMAQLVAEADELRMATARAMATEILTPRQAVEMLAAAKQLHLSLRDWSRRTEAAGSHQPPPPPPNGTRAVTANSTSAAHRNA
ncbi:hypothetical protein HU200_007784 [Digitaria exilis]|uniref:DOG1 domain-containing protein n=1 Tax=Digitaria exilis TaxID=1010633 RepID=A0A835FM29_9POAL|nr:hypothetical protein HU200_007784 [Digitaria exilis]